MSLYEISDTLKRNNFDCYIVGGYVRDLILGRKSTDIDLATNAKPNDILKLFPTATILDKAEKFPVYLIGDIQISTFRHDMYDNLTDKDCSIRFADTIEQDLERRDLTINSIAFDPIKQKYIDPFNGIEDINNKIIRFTGDPYMRIKEDKNRAFRAARFAALIDGKFTSSTKNAIIEQRNEIIHYTNLERIMIEVIKSMKTIKKSSKFFKALHKLNLLDYVFPSLYNCIGQNGGRHHNEDVFTHCMLTGDAIPIKMPILKLAGYLHDIGKPLSIEYNEKNEISFKRHEKNGIDPIVKELKRLKFSNRHIEIISSLMRLHMRPIGSPKAIRRTLSLLKEKNIHYFCWLILRFSDHNGNLRKDKLSTDEKLEIIDNFEAELLRPIPLDVNKLKINGYDIMTILNCSPGEIIKRVKNRLFDLVDNEILINDKNILIEYVKNTNWN